MFAFYKRERNLFNYIRLGWGSGMTGTTVDLLFKDETREKIRDTCGKAAPGFEAAKSRRTIMNPNGDIKFLPGWVKFKLAAIDCEISLYTTIAARNNLIKVEHGQLTQKVDTNFKR